MVQLPAVASSIADFNGFIGVADVQGNGTATNPDGSTETLLFDTDMRACQRCICPRCASHEAIRHRAADDHGLRR
jgi:hypothetical protein